MAQTITPRFTLTYSVAGSPKSRVSLDYGQFLIGRGSDCPIIIEDLQASRRHAALDLKAEGITLTDLGSHNGTFLTDLGSHNGTFLGGKRIPPQVVIPLETGTPFYIGAVEFSVVDSRAGLSSPQMPTDRAGRASPTPPSALREKTSPKWLLLLLLLILACLLAAGGGMLIFWGSRGQEAIPPGHGQWNAVCAGLSVFTAAL